MFKLDQEMFKDVQKMFKLFQNIFKVVQNMFERCSNMFKLDQACSNMFQTTVDVVWCFLANRRRCASRSKMKQILLKIS